MGEARKSPLGFRWWQSLYTRALVVTLAGCGVLVAFAVLYSSSIVETFQRQLLEERTVLALEIGRQVERVILQDAEQVGAIARAVLSGQSLPEASGRTIFQGRYFVLDAGGLERAGGAGTGDLARIPRMGRLLALARQRGGPVVSEMMSLPPDGGIGLLAVTPVLSADGRFLGYAGGVIAPGALGFPLASAVPDGAEPPSGSVQLVDASGRVVASSDGAAGGSLADHGSVLARAIHAHTPAVSRCHGCHEAGWGVERKDEILAFTPLPGLDLGVAIRQLESNALAPARALRRELILGVAVLLLLFVLVAVLSVRSAVHPVTRLMRAVRRIELPGHMPALPSFGRNEVGELGGALEEWRGRLRDSLDTVERHQQALREEMEVSNRLLGALFSLTESSLQAATVHTIVQDGLAKLLDILHFSTGALRLTYRSQHFDVQRGDFPIPGPEAMEACDRILDTVGTVVVSTSSGTCRTRLVESSRLGPAFPGTPVRTLLLADLEVGGAYRVAAVVGTPDDRRSVEERRLHALLHHIVVGSATLLLKEEEQLRQRQRREYLHRVLAAQEEERRRVARELHDTVSQDCAALRLRLERLSTTAVPVDVAMQLQDLEGKAHDMLDTVRRIMLDLRPAVLDSMGFLPAIQWHLERMERQHGIRGSLTVDGDPVELRSEFALILFRILQECLQNVVQHAAAEHVVVTVGFAAEVLTLTIEDDGRGFDPLRIARRLPDEHGRGLGILGMEERAKILGGTLALDTGPGEGTTVRVTVPLLQEDVLARGGAT